MIRLKSPRLAVRGIVLHENRLLIVNAYPGQQSDLWCAPGGGAEPGQSLPDNLIREIHEETGLTGAKGLKPGFLKADRDGAWEDPEGVVNRRRWVTRAELGTLRHKPDSLGAVAWEPPGTVTYDPLEPLVR